MFAKIAASTGLLGACCWIGRALLHLLGMNDVLAHGLGLAGMVLVVLSAAWLGVALAEKGPVWLRVLIGTIGLVLAWILIDGARVVLGDWMELVAGFGLLLASAVALARTSGPLSATGGPTAPAVARPIPRQRSAEPAPYRGSYARARRVRPEPQGKRRAR